MSEAEKIQGDRAPVKEWRADLIARFLEARDNRLMAQDGDARDSLTGCEEALRTVYLIATTGSPNDPA